MDMKSNLDPEATRAELNEETRRHLSAGRELLWEKLIKERQEKGVPGMLSYLRSYLEETCQSVKNELEALHKEVTSGG
jgi:hypothetical protein